MMKELTRLHALGFGVHLLQERSKAPIESGWTSGPRKSVIQLKQSYRPGMNIGTRLGAPSKIGKRYLAVIDCDVKSKDSKHLAEMESKLKELFGEKLAGAPTVMSGRGGGSRHIYIVTTTPASPKRLGQAVDKVKVKMPSVKASRADTERLSTLDLEAGYRMRAAWEISLMGEGQQVVLPPSVHPDTGRNYMWSTPFKEAEDAPLVDVSALEGTAKGDTKKKALLDWEPEEVFLDLEPVSERVKRMIVEGEGVEDDSAALFAAALAMSGAGMSERAILSVLTDRDNHLGACAYRHTQSSSRRKAAEWVERYTLRRAKQETSAARLFREEAEIEEKPLSPEKAKEQEEKLVGKKQWWQGLIDRVGGKENGPPKSTLKNLVLILENAVEGTPFYRNLFSMRDFYGTDTPWGGKKNTALADEDLIKIKMWFASNFRFEPNQNLIVEAVVFIASKNAFHPVRDYLKSLKWDGVPRINTWLRDYLGVRFSPIRLEYFEAISRKYLLSMVARVMDPGCQVDSFVVLEGVQGIGKSSTGRILASSEWYCDTLPDIKDKDAMLNLQGAWIVEISELAVLRNAQSMESYKAFLSRRVDRLRSPYGRLTGDVPRQCVFLGTTNDEDYLKDKGGNRRFWPAKATQCDFEGLTRDRDQLFAEAYAAYMSGGERLDLQGEAKVQGELEQAARVVEDESDHMAHLITAWMKEESEKPEKERFNFERFRLADLFGDFGPLKNDFQAKNYYLQLAGRVLVKLNAKKRVVRGSPFWEVPLTPSPRKSGKERPMW